MLIVYMLIFLLYPIFTHRRSPVFKSISFFAPSTGNTCLLVLFVCCFVLRAHAYIIQKKKRTVNRGKKEVEYTE